MSLNKMEVEEINMVQQKRVIYNPFPEPSLHKFSPNPFNRSPMTTTESEFQTDGSAKRSPETVNYVNYGA